LKKNIKNLKICICTIGKEENKYIREFVKYYEKYGVDKIFLYDNNDINMEHFDDVIKDYIDKDYVKIFNLRGIEKPHFKALNDCYIRYNKEYDWFLFYDIIYYQNLSLFKRFPELERKASLNINYKQKVKSILRGNISGFEFANDSHASHIITNSVKACNGFGKEIQLDNEYFMPYSDAKYYYIDHFYTKSVEEFINKINRGSAVQGNDTNFKLFRVFRYFSINELRYSKFKYIKKKLGIHIGFNKKLNKNI